MNKYNQPSGIQTTALTMNIHSTEIILNDFPASIRFKVKMEHFWQDLEAGVCLM